MPFIFHVTLLCVLVFRYSDASRYFMKPSFPNYCDMKDKCKPACNCEVYPNCSLLSMDETVRKTILFYHNQIRDIQSAGEPQPAGMTMLQYDMQLEEISKCWAARCDNEYSVCFKSSRFRETSQSVGGLILEGEESPNVFLWLQMMSYWLGQAEVVSAKAIHSLPADQKHESMHNFAQLMSDNVLSVGCAWSILTTDNWLIFVCTYGPRGPQQGEAIYRTGYPCSHCPEDYACDYVKPFERLCKPKMEEPAPPSSFPPVRKELIPQEQPDNQGDSVSSSPSSQRKDPNSSPQQNSYQQFPQTQREFKAPELPASSSVKHAVYRTLTDFPPTYNAAQYPKTVQASAPQEHPLQGPPVPSEPKSYRDIPQPSFPPAHTSYYSQITSPDPQQFPRYIPQPPPLPRLPTVFEEPPGKPFIPPYNNVASPSQSHQFQPQIPAVPLPPRENIPEYFQPQQQPPIIPPPPMEDVFTAQKPQYNQGLPPYRVPYDYSSRSVQSNISPQIPQPPSIDLPQPPIDLSPPPIPVNDFRYYSPTETPPNVRYLPSNYDAHSRRSSYPNLKPYFGYPEIAMQTSSTVSLSRQQELPIQLNRAIFLPQAEPLPPPLSYFPPQPPPLPRETSLDPPKYDGNPPNRPPLPLPSEGGPPIQPPPRQITSLTQQKPDSSQYSFSVQPYEQSRNPQSDVTYPPTPRPDALARRVKDRRTEQNDRPRRSGGLQESLIVAMILSNLIFIFMM